MHSRSCTDVKGSGRTKESLEVQKQTDGADMHKRIENGIWLPTGRQIGTGHVCIPASVKGECYKQASNKPQKRMTDTLMHIFIILNYIDII